MTRCSKCRRRRPAKKNWANCHPCLDELAAMYAAEDRAKAQRRVQEQERRTTYIESMNLLREKWSWGRGLTPNELRSGAWPEN